MQFVNVVTWIHFAAFSTMAHPAGDAYGSLHYISDHQNTHGFRNYSFTNMLHITHELYFLHVITKSVINFIASGQVFLLQ